jgi:hypothetical protein
VKWSTTATSDDVFNAFRATAIGSDNNSVRVDTKGNPIDASRPGSVITSPLDVLNMGGPRNRWFIYLDPAKVSRFTITPSLTWDFEFKNVALEPTAHLAPR